MAFLPSVSAIHITSLFFSAGTGWYNPAFLLTILFRRNPQEHTADAFSSPAVTDRVNPSRSCFVLHSAVSGYLQTAIVTILTQFKHRGQFHISVELLVKPTNLSSKSTRAIPYLYSWKICTTHFFLFLFTITFYHFHWVYVNAVGADVNHFVFFFEGAMDTQ